MKILNEQRWTHDHRFYPDLHDVTVGPGPWWDEPDKVQWIDGDTDLDCLAVRNPMGAWCGYVGVPKGHSFHGKHYTDIDMDVYVHGGLTFADGCEEDAPEGHGICHVPLPGREDDVWWLGFDCGHLFDVQPVMQAMMPELHSGGPRLGGHLHLTYKTLEYVQRECADLAKQLAT